ncbi:MAG TPA: hypothetical protein VKA54_14120 [Gemmatimonadaceae bacterium]|nr:hypothetical protein [Gemmatimonadaceae bacterium]
MRPVITVILFVILALPVRGSAQSHDAHDHSSATRKDSAFGAMQARGKQAMGVDQYTSVHRFDDLEDGGRIELQRDRDDVEGVAAIRVHLRAIARAFAVGDFSTPATVHLESVPGSATMRARRRAIRYEPVDLPRGAALRIHTRDWEAIAAVHQFLAYQRREHRAAGATVKVH